MTSIRWKRAAARYYRCEHGTIMGWGGNWLVSLDPYLVRDPVQRSHIADSLGEAKKVADARISAWLDCAALLDETDRRLTHYEQIMRRLEPIGYRYR